MAVLKTSFWNQSGFQCHFSPGGRNLTPKKSLGRWAFDQRKGPHGGEFDQKKKVKCPGVSPGGGMSTLGIDSHITSTEVITKSENLSGRSSPEKGASQPPRNFFLDSKSISASLPSLTVNQPQLSVFIFSFLTSIVQILFTSSFCKGSYWYLGTQIYILLCYFAFECLLLFYCW